MKTLPNSFTIQDSLVASVAAEFATATRGIVAYGGAFSASVRRCESFEILILAMNSARGQLETKTEIDLLLKNCKQALTRQKLAWNPSEMTISWSKSEQSYVTKAPEKRTAPAKSETATAATETATMENGAVIAVSEPSAEVLAERKRLEAFYGAKLAHKAKRISRLLAVARSAKRAKAGAVREKTEIQSVLGEMQTREQEYLTRIAELESAIQALSQPSKKSRRAA